MSKDMEARKNTLVVEMMCTLMWLEEREARGKAGSFVMSQIMRVSLPC